MNILTQIIKGLPQDELNSLSCISDHNNSQETHFVLQSTSSNRCQQYSDQKQINLPLTLTSKKCKKCRVKDAYISKLAITLLNMEASILQKQQQMNLILSQQKNKIKQLEDSASREELLKKTSSLGSTLFSLNLDEKFDNQIGICDQFQCKQQKNNLKLYRAVNVKITTERLQQRRTLSQQQNISPNPTIITKNKLKFQNQSLYDYNISLQSQIERLKKAKRGFQFGQYPCR